MSHNERHHLIRRGLLISDRAEPEPTDTSTAWSKLIVSVSGSNYASPEHLVDIAHVEFSWTGFRVH